MKNIIIPSHPLLSHNLAILRDKTSTREAFLNAFQKEGTEIFYDFKQDELEYKKICDKYSSSEWVYSKFKNSSNPSIRLPQGILEYDKNSNTLFSDILEVELIDEINKILANSGSPFSEISELKQNVNFDKNLIDEIAEFLKNIV